MDSSIKNKVVKGAFWSILERMGYLGIQFITNIVLARLLTPKEFGTVGILLIFTSLSLVLVDGGLSSALIQKKNINEVDKNTVFFTNFGMSMFIYLIIFFAAPWITTFFDAPGLTLYLRWICIVIIIDAMSSIQFALLNRQVNFKKIARIKILAAIVSTSIAIVLAWCGAGIWALILQYVIFSIVRCLLLWHKGEYLPKIQYSYKAFKTLFSFGSKLLLSTFIADLYINFQSIIIGKKYLATDLGYYTQAKQLQSIPVGAISHTINSVSFPVYASLQDNFEKLVELLKKNLKSAIFLNFPLMIFLTVMAKDIIIFFYSAKWIPSVPFFQFLCAGFGLLLIVHQTNLSVLKAIGKSNVVLYLEIIKKILGVTLIIGGCEIFGIMGLMYALTINSIIEFFLNGYWVGKYLQYGIWEQFRDIFPTLLISFASGIIVYFFNIKVLSFDSPFIQLLIGGSLYLITYLFFAYIFKLSAFRTYKNLILSKIKRK